MSTLARGAAKAAFTTLVAAGLLSVNVSEAANPNTFRRTKIADARFGTGDRQKLLEKSYRVADTLESEIYGQDIAAQLVQDRLTQYFENFGTHTGEPIALNLIGLPGIGKSAIIKKLMSLGFPIVHLDAQTFTGKKDYVPDFGSAVADLLEPYVKSKLPVILVVEEIDKTPEIVDNAKEETSPLIGQLNQMLSDGMLSRTRGVPLQLSNVMFMTTMNFSPKEIESFSKEALGEPKSYYDFTIDDFASFDSWIRNQASARYKILSRIFRSNTVSRLGENTVILQPLGTDEYRAISDQMVRRAVKAATTGDAAEKRVSIDVAPAVVDFLAKETTYAPSGARATVQKSDALIGQLINFGIKAKGPNRASVDRPRRIFIGVDAATRTAQLTVTPLIYHHPNLVDGKPFSISARFDPGSRLFLPPRDSLITSKPQYKKIDVPTVKPEDVPVTKKEVYQTRFPKVQSMSDGLAEAIEAKLFGQDEAVAIIKNDMDRYLSRLGPAKKEPSLRVLSGFPGIGKSEIVKITGQALNLPVVKINMQQFSSDSAETVKSFLTTLANSIDKARADSKNGGRFILLLEELDKTFEVAPDGSLVNRPIMALIKDLMNDGVARGEGKYGEIVVDIRDAFTFVTMNFSVDRFGFTADPRMTSIEDVIKAWKQLKTTPMSIKKVLGAMFLPETVNRLMARFTIMKPVDRPSYLKIINAQVKAIIDERLLDKHGRNVGQIAVRLTPAYRAYLFSESVIPSEGARNTVVDAQKMISRDLNSALDNLPLRSAYSKAPLILTLDFNESKSTVRGTIQRSEVPGDKPMQIFVNSVALKFPSPKLRGRVSETRMKTSAHEFGHAFVATLLGLRIEHVVVVPPNPEAGGYVKFRDGGSSAQEMMSNVYATVASRALERMVLSREPLNPFSTMDISAGPSQDIKQATVTLYNMLYELGFDPNGGTVDRNFSMGMGKYASYSDMPSDLAEKLGLILRDMENYALEDLLKRHDQSWYVEKIVKLARAGAVTEAEFYKLIGYTDPGPGRSYGVNSNLRSLFGRYLETRSKEELAARAARQGNSARTAEENVQDYLAVFAESVRARLHPDAQSVQMISADQAPAPKARLRRIPNQCADLFQ